MYYNKIYDFIKKLDSTNIEEYKPQLTKYIIELMLSFKDYNNSISLEDLQFMLDTALLREEFQCELKNELEEEGFKLGLLTGAFIDIYKEFTSNIAENGYINDAISLTRSVIKALDCISIPFYLIKKNGGFNEENLKYMESIDYLNDLQEELGKYLNQYVTNTSKEYFNVLGLVEYIKKELEENINNIGHIIMSQLSNKSLEDFNKEEHMNEYKAIFKKEYIEELKRRKYQWSILTSKLKENYFRDELYKDLDRI
ncbi:hypothetical protein [Clostridium septicum]|uniref:Uncharacterized protein n=1 Tax=Clostridium septicum TaxID=1504 RepID=A0A9N7JJR6_CLOSE|nr:hypothetical protein [Clostridium septicum]AYE33783.1 hypothetical protein CP523_04485 [Clostridium septicum]MDU1313696.1 hypothetical protein [Clostridium septicum]QAS61940.1 hypothetical protein EI377_15025 [Clostridium septicum]UEC21607.1 hypothetical protein LK444_04350 [Clostridium septicum]USS00344.1 hypothetical protein NH397_12730 [Clostridium septicum]